MNMKYVIAYDLGTGGVKTSIFNEKGISCGFHFIPYDTFFPSADFREQSPQTWWQAVKESTKVLISKTSINVEDIVSLAVSGHSLGVVPIGYRGELLLDYVPIWNDSRAKEQAKDFFTRTSEEEWYLSTGNGFPPELYSIFKIMWYRDNMPDVYDKTNKFIGTKDFINYKMTGVIATDKSYASGSGVYNLKEGKYNEKYIEVSKIDISKLPPILKSTDVVGEIIPEIANELGLSPKTLVIAGGVDNACMALGAGCVENGSVYTSLGTSAWIAVCDSNPIVDIGKRPYVFEHCVEGKYVSATAIFSAGNSLRWVRDNLFSDLCQNEAEGGDSAYKIIDELADSSPLGANKLFFIPTLSGASCLDKSKNAKGMFIGLDLMHTRADLARATLEGIALNLRFALNVLADYAKISDDMLIVGGGAKSKVWRQIFADIYNKNIITTDIGEDAGSFGAAAIAGVGADIWTDFSEAINSIATRTCISPSENMECYNSLHSAYKQLLDISADAGDIINMI